MKPTRPRDVPLRRNNFFQKSPLGGTLSSFGGPRVGLLRQCECATAFLHPWFETTVCCSQGRNERGSKGGTISRAPIHYGAPNHCQGRQMTARSAEKS